MRWAWVFAWLCLLASSSPILAEKLKVHVIFAQHLDVGYNSRVPGVIGTDDAAINIYFDHHFQAAIATANAFRQLNTTRTYKWMGHAWLFSLFFDCPIGMGIHCPSEVEKTAVEEAILRGDIYWHALPFNGQTEFFDVPLLESAAFLVHRLDDQFKLPHKRVASLRDVPGVTRATIPILNRHGIVALSQGVNGASAPPGLPLNTLHFWQDPLTGGKLLHWVHGGGYSGWPQDPAEDCLKLPGVPHILCHAWKQDNEGPHDVTQALAIYNFYEAAFPGAEVTASTFDHFLGDIEDHLQRADLPVYSAEIGDTWIYGIPSDAVKVSRYMAALRLRNTMTWAYDDYALHNFSRLLMKIPEHTWGVDIKETIRDYANWDNSAFHSLLAAKAKNFEQAVYSWKRQAKYVDWALEALGLFPEDLEPHLASHLPEALEEGLVSQRPESAEYSAGSWTFALDPETGSFSKLQRRWGGAGGVDWASNTSAVGQLMYDTYVESDFNVIFDHYTFAADARSWADYDFGKTNCTEAGPTRASSYAKPVKTWANNDGDAADVLVHSKMPDWTWKKAGAPQQVYTRIRSTGKDDSLYLDFTLRLKTATRLPEALWVRFRPDGSAADPSSWLLYKLGQPISPLEVMRNGSHSQHTVSPEGISVTSLPDQHGVRETLNIRSLDAPLVSPGTPKPFPIVDEYPDLSQGVSYNLLNNIWGTNYPQWQPYDESGTNLTFRFVLTVERSAPPQAVAIS